MSNVSVLDPVLIAIAKFERKREAADVVLKVYEDVVESGDFLAAEKRFGILNTAAFFSRDAAMKTAPRTKAGALVMLRLVAPTVAELGHDPVHQPALVGAIEAVAAVLEREA